ncbi:hypothetical protein [Paenibacillus polymyxa]|uniref:hypothetical protein n=1 Tax=Paenibacillus polymyxa TaxID=1406 RepID=UPI000CDA183A|nr:hypothetical protein [Paenibacillus polymyxa]POR29283.1 hypothetical protein CG775_06930 [Paenibacillus polymyxa]
MQEEENSSWVLYSERALDTLCICGLRGRSSRGTLPPVNEYQAVDESKVALHRPAVKGTVEDITQNDLDILRAVITHYVFENGYDSVNAKNGLLEDEQLLILITPGRIRELLQMSRHDLPTRQITHSLQKLEELKIKAQYHVRNEKGSHSCSIEDHLFELGIGSSDSGKRVNEYALLFNTGWGRYFMHNVRCGNFVVIRDFSYAQLNNGAKNLFYTVMSLPNHYFYRRQDKLLSLINSKDDQNQPRAITRLEEYLNDLTDQQLITWKLEKGVYHIKRLYKPANGTLDIPFDQIRDAQNSEEGPSNGDTENIEKEEEYKEMGWILKRLMSKEKRSKQENMYYEIVQGVEAIKERTSGIPDAREFKNDFTQAILRKDWQSYSPYYLWTHPEFREWFSNHDESKWNETYRQYQGIFRQVESNTELMGQLVEWRKAVEDYLKNA